MHATSEEFLGIDTEGIRGIADKDANGNDVPDNYNLLGTKIKALCKINEVYIDGATPNLTTMPYDALFDISVNLLAIIATDGSATWAADPNVIHKSAAADTDGDGIEEVVNAVFDTVNYSLKVRVFKKAAGGDTFSNSDVYTLTDISIIAGSAGNIMPGDSRTMTFPLVRHTGVREL